MGEMTITTRRVRPDDVHALKRVRLAALLDTPSAFAMTHEEESGYPDDRWATSAVERSAGREHATFFAFDGDDVVGLVGGHRLDGDQGIELVSMWTSPTARGKGVGAALVDCVVEWAAGETVELWVTRGNDSAQRLYERCGFVETGDFQPLPSDPCKDETRMRRVAE